MTPRSYDDDGLYSYDTVRYVPLRWSRLRKKANATTRASSREMVHVMTEDPQVYVPMVRTVKIVGRGGSPTSHRCTALDVP